MRFKLKKQWYMCPLLKSETGLSDNKKMITLISKPEDIYSATVNGMNDSYYDLTLHYFNDVELNSTRVEMSIEVVEIIEQ